VVLIEGNDGRGIDCAILSRLPVGSVSSYRHMRFGMPGGGMTRFRRDLLRARIEPAGAAAFDVFVVHLKSKRGESGESSAIRMAEAAAVRSVCDDLLKADGSARFVVCGDFNDTWESEPLRTIRGSGTGELKSFFTDVPESSRITYNRDPYRSMIDFVLCSPGMASSYVAGSFRVPDGSIETTGSDHNPISMEFRRGFAASAPVSGR
jgi:endonuclease/exonuclease/phosphatase family metal-dependent hydrolase